MNNREEPSCNKLEFLNIQIFHAYEDVPGWGESTVHRLKFWCILLIGIDLLILSVKNAYIGYK